MKSTKVSIDSESFPPLLLNLPSSTTLQSLKKILVDYTWASEEETMLQILDKNKITSYLLDKNQMIGDIGDGINVNMRLSLIQTKNFDFNNLSKNVSRPVGIATDPQDVMIVKKGLVLHSKCKNNSCIAIGRNIRVNKGIGKFNIGKQILKCRCPKCNEPSQTAHNLGYFQCSITIEGTKSDDSQVNITLNASDDLYHTFSENGPEDFCSWKYIEAVTQDI